MMPETRASRRAGDRRRTCRGRGVLHSASEASVLRSRVREDAGARHPVRAGAEAVEVEAAGEHDGGRGRGRGGHALAAVVPSGVRRRKATSAAAEEAACTARRTAMPISCARARRRAPRKHRQMFGVDGPNAGGRRVRKPDHDSETSSDSVDEDDLPAGSRALDDDPNVDTARVMRVGPRFASMTAATTAVGDGRAPVERPDDDDDDDDARRGWLAPAKPSRGPRAQPGRRRHRRLRAQLHGRRRRRRDEDEDEDAFVPGHGRNRRRGSPTKSAGGLGARAARRARFADARHEPLRRRGRLRRPPRGWTPSPRRRTRP